MEFFEETPEKMKKMFTEYQKARELAKKYHKDYNSRITKLINVLAEIIVWIDAVGERHGMTKLDHVDRIFYYQLLYKDQLDMLKMSEKEVIKKAIILYHKKRRKGVE